MPTFNGVRERSMYLPGLGIGWGEFFRSLRQEYQRDRINDVAGALTFFGVLALFPFLMFVVALASVVIDPAKAQLIIDELARVAPRNVTEILGEQIRSLGRERNVGLLTLGAAAAFYSASRGVHAAMRALNAVYGVEDHRPFWKTRGLAMLMTVASAVIGVLAAVIAVVTPAAAHAVGGPIGTIILWLRIPVAGLLMMFLWALLYYYLPDVEQEFRFITPGSVVGVFLWAIASYGFSLYVLHFGRYDATYGTLGGVIVLLLWMWISSQVLLLGAEINAIVEHKSPGGKGPGARRFGEHAPRATKSEVEAAGGALESTRPGAPMQERVEMERRRRRGRGRPRGEPVP